MQKYKTIHGKSFWRLIKYVSENLLVLSKMLKLICKITSTGRYRINWTWQSINSSSKCSDTVVNSVSEL